MQVYDKKAQSLHRLGYFINQKYCNFKKNSILAQLYDIDLILLPESLFVLFWNLYIILMINCSVFYISIKFAFDLDNRPSDYRYSRNMLLYVLPLIAFVLEILIKFNLSFYRKGALITERSLIREKYIKEDFLLDSIVILSQMMYQFGGVHYFDLVVLTKITQMPRLFETLLDKLELTLNSMAIYDFFRLIYLIIVACHFCTCCWFYIGIMEVGSSWLTVQQIIDADWIVQYTTAFYWSMITMCTIGYGDISPTNLLERSFMIFFALFSCCIFAYSIGNISDIFGLLQLKKNQLRMDINNLKKYLRIKGYSPKVQLQTRRYFEYLWSSEIYGLQLDIEKVKNQIPQNLQEKMLIDLNLKNIQQTFLRYFNSEFQEKLAIKMIEEKFAPQQMIFQKNSPTAFFYILSQGQVEYCIELPNHKIVTLQAINKPTAICPRNFISQMAYEVTCITKTSCRILKISKEEFLDLAQKYDYETYCNLRDNVMNKEFDSVDEICASCGKQQHSIIECPLITGFPNRTKVLLNHRKNTYDQRKVFRRNNQKRRISALGRESEVCDSVLGYLLNNKQLIPSKINQDSQMKVIIARTRSQKRIPTLSNYNPDIFKNNTATDKLAKSRMMITSIQERMEQSPPQTQRIETDDPNNCQLIQKNVKFRDIPSEHIYFESIDSRNDVQQTKDYEPMHNHKDIYLDFDKACNYEKYKPSMNLSKLIVSEVKKEDYKTFVNFLDINLVRQIKLKKRNSQRQKT